MYDKFIEVIDYYAHTIMLYEKMYYFLDNRFSSFNVRGDILYDDCLVYKPNQPSALCQISSGDIFIRNSTSYAKISINETLQYNSSNEQDNHIIDESTIFQLMTTKNPNEVFYMLLSSRLYELNCTINVQSWILRVDDIEKNADIVLDKLADARYDIERILNL